MFQHILIPTDGSLLSASALDSGLRFARWSGARVTVLAVTEPFAVLSAEARKMGRSQVAYEQEVKEEAARHLTEAGRKAAELDVACETIEVENEHPYRAIIETAIQRGCDLITMASHALTAPVTTSQTLSVLAHSDIPVLVYR